MVTLVQQLQAVQVIQEEEQLQVPDYGKRLKGTVFQPNRVHKIQMF